MQDKDAANPVAAALRYLTTRNQFLKFDNQERVLEVSVGGSDGCDEFAKHIGFLRDVRKLALEGPDLTDSGLKYLASLTEMRELSLHGTHITSVGLLSLAGMCHLSDMDISDARHFGRAEFACLAGLVSLRELAITGGHYCDADLEPLHTLSNLEELRVYDNGSIHGTFAKYLTESPQLWRLSIDQFDGQVTDDGVDAISMMSRLSDLCIAGPFTDSSLPQLAALQNLRSLTIHSDYVTAKGICFVQDLPNLSSLSLDVPHLADDCVPALLKCSALEDLGFRRPALSEFSLQLLRDELPRCSVTDLERDRCEFGPPSDKARPEWGRMGSSAPFLKLLAHASDFDLVNGTFVKIGDRYNHWVDASKYSDVEKVIMLVWHSGGIIDNGGCEYLFAGEFPGDPDYRITAEAYKTAGLLRGYEAFQEAFALFPDEWIPHDPVKRDEIFQETNRSARDRINRKLWQDFGESARERKLAEFIRANAAALMHLDDAL